MIQHRNWPLRPTILNAHGTNASPDGLCTRTHANEAFSCWFCCTSFRLDRARRGNVCIEAWAVFKKLGTYVPGTSTSIIRVYHNVFFLFRKKCCRARPQPTTLSTGRPTVSLRDMLQVALLLCQARSTDGGTGRVCGRCRSCGT